jgi:hypothetical protein
MMPLTTTNDKNNGVGTSLLLILVLPSRGVCAFHTSCCSARVSEQVLQGC